MVIELNIKKRLAFSLFEMILTITVASIIFVIAGIFMSKPVLFFNKITKQVEAIYKLNIGLRRISHDFMQYDGGISVFVDAPNTLSLSFNIPSSASVTYTCDFNSKVVYRATNTQGSQVLLNNLANCSFSYNISNDNNTIFLHTRLTVIDNDIPVTLTEIVNAKNV